MQKLEHDTGRRLTRNGVEWPIRHVLSEHPYGWVISRDVCGGDRSLETREDYDTEGKALEAWARLTGSK